MYVSPVEANDYITVVDCSLNSACSAEPKIEPAHACIAHLALRAHISILASLTTANPLDNPFPS
jgi:hypothetical protein